MYADAWTILGYALGDLRLHGMAESALARAESIDPGRNWPALARADLALARGDFEAARVAMRVWLRRHPFDQAARAKVAAIAAAAAKAGEADRFAPGEGAAASAEAAASSGEAEPASRDAGSR
ncbi:MAG: hypothetical protein ABR587_10580, partial [Candidatus Binatia bacterium]